MDNQLLFSSRLDNLFSCYSGIKSLANIKKVKNGIPFLALFDHEEIGSHSYKSAGSTFLANFLKEIQEAFSIKNKTEFNQKSLLLSADMAHGLHPNYPHYQDSLSSPALGKGVVIKINEAQNYSCDAGTRARVVSLLKEANIPFQYYQHKNGLPCGSTMGPILAQKLGIPSIDMGVAQLAMHSIRETMHVDDIEPFLKLSLTFFETLT